MTDFNIEEEKKKLEQDIKDAIAQGQAFERDVNELLKKVEAAEAGRPDLDTLVSDKEEEEALNQIRGELDESLNNAVLDLAGKAKE